MIYFNKETPARYEIRLHHSISNVGASVLKNYINQKTILF